MRSAQRLTQAAHIEGLPPPGAPGLDLGQRRMLTTLQASSEAGFDRLYLHQQVRASKQLLIVLDGYIESGHAGAIETDAIETDARERRGDLALRLQRLERANAALS